MGSESKVASAKNAERRARCMRPALHATSRHHESESFELCLSPPAPPPQPLTHGYGHGHGCGGQPRQINSGHMGAHVSHRPYHGSMRMRHAHVGMWHAHVGMWHAHVRHAHSHRSTRNKTALCEEACPQVATSPSHAIHHAIALLPVKPIGLEPRGAASPWDKPLHHKDSATHNR